jgi:hypothetical protein
MGIIHLCPPQKYPQTLCVYKNIFYTVQRALMKFEGHDNDNNNSFIKKIKNIGNEDFFLLLKQN